MDNNLDLPNQMLPQSDASIYQMLPQSDASIPSVASRRQRLPDHHPMLPFLLVCHVFHYLVITYTNRNNIQILLSLQQTQNPSDNDEIQHQNPKFQSQNSEITKWCP